MGKVIYKYPLRASMGIVGSLMLPEGAEVLSVAGQRGEIVVYAMVDPDERTTVSRTFYVVPTGHPFRCLSSQDFMGTVSLCNGDLMFHIFRDAEEVQP